MLAEEGRFESKLLCTLLLPSLFCPQPTLYLPKRLELGLHYEVILAELTASSVWALDPLVETGLVDKAQGSCAATGCDEWALLISFAVTDPGEERSTKHEFSQRTLLPHGALPCLSISGCIRNCNLQSRTHGIFTPALVVEPNLWSRPIYFHMIAVGLQPCKKVYETFAHQKHIYFILTVKPFQEHIFGA